jgi:hypothetical protein
VTKVTLVQEEEAGFEEVGEDNEEEVAESQKDSQSPKKKIESPFPGQKPEPPIREQGQVGLFAEPEKPKSQLPSPQRPAPRRKAEQQSLFGENPGQENSREQENESEAQSELGTENLNSEPLERRNTKNGMKNDDKSFNVGETIEFEL